MKQSPEFTNRLAEEKSPYLLQHAHNPVDWYAWGEQAFDRAISQDKPVILSIGYSTCHWCHVMEAESFEDPQTAQLMNQNFISIKVDREERPDIDSVYMSYVMATTGSGGWPMTVFLTPDKKPFYGGTYFPPQDRYGIPGFKTLLASIAEAWTTRRAEIVESADSAASFLKGQARGDIGRETPLSHETLYTAFERYKASFDAVRGGFGPAPKFPRSHSLSLLLRYWARSGNSQALEMVEKTLLAMADGGMHDQLGGGFHRYSTDAQWRVPHFEKMLYDQALLVLTTLEVYQATGKKIYGDSARKTLDYVLREMTGPEGGFFSAQDADSADPDAPGRKREGAYFVWKKSEIDQALGPNAELFSFYYGIEAGGNALSDPHGEFTGYNVLYRARSVEETAARFQKTSEETRHVLSAGCETLWKLRSRRPLPHLDDKILTDWNGLMIAAFASAARVLNEPRYGKAAEEAARFIRDRLKDAQGGLLHRYRDGQSAIPGHVNDYAFLAYGYLRLYEATFEALWLAEARGTVEEMLRLFWDADRGGFFLTAINAEALIARPREIYDGAVPSGNSIAALALFLLERFTGERDFKKLGDLVLKAFSTEIAAEPTAYPQMLMALDFALGPSAEIVIADAPGDGAAAEAMLREIYLRFMPNKIIMLHKPGHAGAALEALAPHVKSQAPVAGKTAAYVCRDHACAAPVTDLQRLNKLLTSY